METTRLETTRENIDSFSAVTKWFANELAQQDFRDAKMNVAATQREQNRFARAQRRQLLIVDENWW